jgi:hypothetical protein
MLSPFLPSFYFHFLHLFSVFLFSLHWFFSLNCASPFQANEVPSVGSSSVGTRSRVRSGPSLLTRVAPCRIFFTSGTGYHDYCYNMNVDIGPTLFLQT